MILIRLALSLSGILFIGAGASPNFVSRVTVAGECGANARKAESIASDYLMADLPAYIPQPQYTSARPPHVGDRYLPLVTTTEIMLTRDWVKEKRKASQSLPACQRAAIQEGLTLYKTYTDRAEKLNRLSAHLAKPPYL